jgi:hypothetical protein
LLRQKEGIDGILSVTIQSPSIIPRLEATKPPLLQTTVGISDSFAVASFRKLELAGGG